MKITVVIPVYNIEKRLIDRCVDSIVKQDFDDYEILIINDGSTDDTSFIIDSYEYEQIKTIHLEKNIRQGGARNVGIKKARGEYILFVDGDDWIAPNMLKELYYQASNYNADIVDSDHYQETSNGEIQIRKSMDLEDVENMNINALILNHGRLTNKLFRKDMLLSNKLFFIQEKKFEDNPYQPIVLPYAKKIVKVDKAFYFYAYNDDSTARRLDDYTVFDRLDTAEYLIETAKERGLYEMYKQEYDYLFFNLYFINSIIMCYRNFSKPELNYIEKIFEDFSTFNISPRENLYYKDSPRYVKLISNLNLTHHKLLAKIYPIVSKSQIFMNAFVSKVKK